MLPPKPSRLQLANLPTPMRLLERTSARMGGPRIWLKQDDLSGALTSGNKVRKLEFLLAEAKEQGCDSIITCGGVQSNHCRATAALSAQLGLQCHLILRGPATLGNTDQVFTADQLFSEGSEGNLLLDQLCGAEITIYSPSFYATHLEAIFHQAANKVRGCGGKPYCIPVGGSNATGLWGYLSAAEELVTDFSEHKITPDALVCATGSGGTQGGLTLGMHLLAPRVPVHGFAVCDSSEYFENKIRHDVKGWQNKYMPDGMALNNALSISTFENYIGPGYAKGYPELFECIKQLARDEGLVLDPVYTGKAFYGMLEEIKNGAFTKMKDIVFVHTGGIYGVFPFKKEFMELGAQ